MRKPHVLKAFMSVLLRSFYYHIINSTSNLFVTNVTPSKIKLDICSTIVVRIPNHI